jgi:hypothetical protein
MALDMAAEQLCAEEDYISRVRFASSERRGCDVVEAETEWTAVEDAAVRLLT